ncbi:hypothetical protein AC1031_011290 [Aphanomyces cochlioides]|nr:hypothetical protein AC1031_011290 [Aphanomyces cochlioides]
MAISLEPKNFFSQNEFLIGDSAYALQTHLLRPYKAPKSKIRENKSFNYHFSAIRMTIEHCIESHDMVVQMILVCIILHNICISQDDDRNEEYNIDLQDPENDEADENRDDSDTDEIWTPANAFQLEIQKHLVLRHFNYI